MGKWKERLGYIKAALGAVVALIVAAALWFSKRAGRKIGEANERYKADVERIEEARSEEDGATLYERAKRWTEGDRK